MTVGSVSDVLVRRLGELGTSEAVSLVQQFQSGQITERDFIASASHYLRLTRVDEAGAFNRAAALHAPRGLSLLGPVYASIFSEPDRGKKVTATERAILSGAINPMEVLNA